MIKKNNQTIEQRIDGITYNTEKSLLLAEISTTESIQLYKTKRNQFFTVHRQDGRPEIRSASKGDAWLFYHITADKRYANKDEAGL